MPEQSSFVAASPLMQRLINTADMIGPTDATVLVQGESGSGKEVVAQYLHHRSRRADGPFVAVNCGALPESLVESELFGHSKGAFTGATAAHIGQVRAAQNGTLFLDEIGELPLSAQAKLLRFLETRYVRAVGSVSDTLVDVRIIAATNRDLAEEVDKGLFRQDLFYRLHVVPLELAPLRERVEDIQPLIDLFSREVAERYQLSPPVFSKEALQRLKKYHWPGNVRELRNLCERLTVLFPGAEVGADNLPGEVHSGRKRPEAAEEGFCLPNEGIDLAQVEADFLRQALSLAGGNQSHAARLLGLTRDTFLYRLRKYAIS